MKLDPIALRYLSDDDFRVLTAVEMGMRNHELVPIPLISTISGLRHGGYMKSLKEVHKHKLVHKETKRYIGYRLTSLGYDYLALRALVKRGVIDGIGRPLGVGKEADVVIVSASEQMLDMYPELDEHAELAMKIHRLGRTSFRAVKNKRDYLVHRKSASWIYFSRLAAMKEYAFMCALHERGFPIPRPLGQSRHIVVMELCPGGLLSHVEELDNAIEVGNMLLGVAKRLAEHGLVHCDLNEFNVLVDDDGGVKVIDFPQMVSTSHVDAELLFDRDVDGIKKFFCHRFGVDEADLNVPNLREILKEREGQDRIDTIVSASGFKNVDQEGRYGIQDLVEGEEEGDLAIDPTSLELNVPQEGNGGEEKVVGDEGDGGVQEAAEDIEEGQEDDERRVDMSLIEQRVRKQRGNQVQRRRLAKKNIVKDSEKRKVKVEMESGVW